MKNWPQISTDMEKELDKCFVCGDNNPIGLKVHFHRDGETVRAEFTARQPHQGWSGIVHGGITMALLDEAMSYASLFSGINTVTAKMQVRFRQTIPIDAPLSITGEIVRRTRKLMEARGAIYLEDGTLAAEATATQFAINTPVQKDNDDE